MWQNTVVIGVSLSKPHVDYDNGPRTQNNGISVSVYHLPQVCHTLVPEIHVRPEMLRVFRHIEVLMCVIYNLTEQQGRSSAMKTINEDRLSDRLENEHTHGISGFSLLIH